MVKPIYRQHEFIYYVVLIQTGFINSCFVNHVLAKQFRDSREKPHIWGIWSVTDGRFLTNEELI